MRKKSICRCFGFVAVVSLSVSAASVLLYQRKTADIFEGSGIESDGGLMAGYPLSTSGQTSYSSYLIHYFDNLTNNFGMNYAGSCGYVALGMLLSYYDACYDGSLIPTQYDVTTVAGGNNLIDRRSSPGILHDDYDTTDFSYIYSEDSFDKWDYLDYVSEISSISLHAKLIEIGDLLSFYGYLDSQPATTTASQRKTVLSYYLQNVVGLSADEFTISFNDFSAYYNGVQGAAKSAIISYVTNGQPVLVGIYNSTTNSGHAVIAYDYDQQTNTIYYHPGVSHNGYTTHMSISEMSYVFITSYMTVAFNLDSPTPGTNYGVGLIEESNQVSYYNYLDSEVNWQSTHSHAYNDHYSMISNDFHKSYCSCGDYLLSTHSVSMVNYDHHSLAYGFCDFCGGIVHLC